MAFTYKARHGVDWPAEMPDQLIDLTVGKKWREFKKQYGVEFKDPWEPMLDAAKSLLDDDAFRVSPWTEEHFHDFVMYPQVITWGSASSGKALPITERVYFPDRVGTLEEVCVGTKILAATGHPVTVIGIRDQIDHPLFRLTFEDGTATVCSPEHLWTVRYVGQVYERGDDGKRTRTYKKVTKTVDTSYLASLKPSCIKHGNYAVPLVKPLEFTHRDVPLDPYVLGCLLGDGEVTQRVCLTSHVKDKELRDRFKQGLPSGVELVHNAKVNPYAYRVVKQTRKPGKNPVAQILRKLQVYGLNSHNKHVPELYKINSSRIRIELLAGLLDTDGSVSEGGKISFKTVSKQLAEDVVFLAQSIGARTSLCKHGERVSYLNGKAIHSGPIYVVIIKGLPLSISSQLFYLSRKRNRLREPCNNLGYKIIRSVEKIEERERYDRRTRCLVLAEKDDAGNSVEGLFPVGNFTVTHNSNDYGLLLVLDWLVDPFSTVTLLGSTTLTDLRSRSWEAVERYFSHLKNNKQGFVIPGKLSKVGFKLMNVTEDENAASVGEKAGIQGRALNEDGRLQGAHARYVRLVVDELAEISNFEALKVAMANLRVGATDFRVIGLANPSSWENESCQFCVPPGGPASVNVDTGSWMSERGYFVRHHDGLKSINIMDSKNEERFPFLMTQSAADQVLKDCDGNIDAPAYWKMVRGFPVPSGAEAPVVLNPVIARQNHVSERLAFDDTTLVGVAAGIDPAWSEGGDGACRQRVWVMRDAFGRPILNFTDGLQRLAIHATDTRPPVQQMRDQVIALMRHGYEASFQNTAIDASAHQGLADDLMIYAGANCLAVNNSVRASDDPIRANDPRPAKETIYDRGTEAWCVLAEFCKAGMVRGLPDEALRALTTRRFATKKDALAPTYPLRLEKKEDFKKRFKHSPDECDACALAALAVKERLGLLPFGHIRQVHPSALTSNRITGNLIGIQMPSGDGFEYDGFEDTYE